MWNSKNSNRRQGGDGNEDERIRLNLELSTRVAIPLSLAQQNESSPFILRTTPLLGLGFRKEVWLAD